MLGQITREIMPVPIENHPLSETCDKNAIIRNFEQGDLATRQDMIIKLWRPLSVLPAKESVPVDISDNISLGMQLLDIMRRAGQWEQAWEGIIESAGQVLDALSRREITLDTLEYNQKARLYGLALSCISVPETTSALAYLEKWQSNIQQTLAIPDELARFFPAKALIESTLLDIAVQLLAKHKAHFITTTTLFYNPDDRHDPFNVPTHLEEAAKLWKHNAQAKLNQLLPGEKLMIPILSTSADPVTQEAIDGHFSAVLAVKCTDNYRFYIFDSMSSPGTSDNKCILIRHLVRDGRKHPICILRDCFQYNNDCGVHTYNFFKLCLDAPADAFSDFATLTALFSAYVEKQYFENLICNEDTLACSRLLRLRFVLDCIRNGYTPGLQDNPQLIERLYRRIENVEIPPASERNPSLCWRNIRFSIINLFSSKAQDGK